MIINKLPIHGWLVDYLIQGLHYAHDQKIENYILTHEKINTLYGQNYNLNNDT